MMNERKTLTLNGLNLNNIIYIFINLIGLAATIYLTTHYYDIHFPQGGLGTGSSACHISDFFNCDAATFSSISNIMGVPLSVFGLFIQISFLLGSLIPSVGFEKTNKTLSLVNAVGCIFLFIFSLVVLGSLCPFCTLFYMTSWISFYLYWKKSDLPFFSFDLTSSAILAVVFFGLVGINYFMVDSRIEKQSKMKSQIFSKFQTLPDLGPPAYVSPFTLTKVPGQLKDAKVWILKFSDFQCPFCQKTAELLEKIAQRYKGKINIHYYFYPLDSNCNSNMKRQLHPFACEAAKLAACDESKFLKVHDEIFANQSSIGSKFLEGVKKEFALQNCEREEVSQDIQNSMNQARVYNVESTPTLVINGRKIETALPLVQWFALIDNLLKQ